MAGAAVRGRLTWQVAEVVGFVDETPTVKSIALQPENWQGHRAGQHIDLRLTAEDGYQAQRSYSIASPPDGELVEITVELVEDGEVSPFLLQELRVGDRIEIRGPIGGYFVWDPTLGGPLQLIGGGSGVVPLMAILRDRVRARSEAPILYLSSARSQEDIIYRSELDVIASGQPGVDVVHTLTRQQPVGWTGPTRRVDRDMLSRLGWSPDIRPISYVCGPTGFVEAVAGILVELGHSPERVKTERFGPTGG